MGELQHSNIAEHIVSLFATANIKNITYEDDLSGVRLQLLNYYHILFGEKICKTCPQNIYSALIYLKNNFESQISNFMAEKSKKYQLKDGASIQFFGDGTLYTNKNLTDDVAESYLKKYPLKAVLFVGYPDTVDELAAEAEASVEREEAAKAAAEAKKAKIDAKLAEQITGGNKNKTGKTEKTDKTGKGAGDANLNAKDETVTTPAEVTDTTEEAK